MLNVLVFLLYCVCWMTVTPSQCVYAAEVDPEQNVPSALHRKGGRGERSRRRLGRGSSMCQSAHSAVSPRQPGGPMGVFKHTHTCSHTHINLLTFLQSLNQHQTPQACPSVVEATHHIQPSEHPTCLFHFWFTMEGDGMERKRQREREVWEIKGVTENGGEDGGMKYETLHQDRPKVLSMQNAMSAPLKWDLFKKWAQRSNWYNWLLHKWVWQLLIVFPEGGFCDKDSFLSPFHLGIKKPEGCVDWKRELYQTHMYGNSVIFVSRSKTDIIIGCYHTAAKGKSACLDFKYRWHLLSFQRNSHIRQ